MQSLVEFGSLLEGFQMRRRCLLTLLIKETLLKTKYFVVSQIKEDQERTEKLKTIATATPVHIPYSEWLLASIAADNVKTETCGNKGTSYHTHTVLPVMLP